MTRVVMSCVVMSCVVIPRVVMSCVAISCVDNAQHLVPRNLTHDFDFICTRFSTFRNDIAVRFNFCDFVLRIKSVVLKTVF